MTAEQAVDSIDELWRSRDAALWEQALQRYWPLVQRKHLDLEQRMERLEVERIRNLNQLGWYEFLRDEYFRWKYTEGRRYATTTRLLRWYIDTNNLNHLHRIKERLLALDRADVWLGLLIADQIRGLGTAGASGLLALLYPETFGTVDQFMVKALREVEALPERSQVAKMKPNNLMIDDGVALIEVMQHKAAELNHRFGTSAWTPRKIDKILWTYGR